MTIDERVQHYASSYSGILPKEVIESSKEWWRKELEEVADQAREEGARAERAKVVEWAKKNGEEWTDHYEDGEYVPCNVVHVDALIAHLSDK